MPYHISSNSENNNNNDNYYYNSNNKIRLNSDESKFYSLQIKYLK